MPLAKLGVSVEDFPTGRLYINQSAVPQIVYIRSESVQLDAGKAMFIDRNGKKNTEELARYFANKEQWDRKAAIEVEVNRSGEAGPLFDGFDLNFLWFPEVGRLKSAFDWAACYKKKFSVCITRDNASYVTKAGSIGGRGDVLMASILAQALKKTYGDKVTVYMKVMKGGEQLLLHNSYVDKVYTDHRDAKADISFALDLTEFHVEMDEINQGKSVNRSRMRIYLDTIGLWLENRTPYYCVTPVETAWAKNELDTRGYDLNRPIIAIQAKGSQPSKSWPRVDVFVGALIKKGYQPFILDEMRRNDPELFRYTFRQMAALIKESTCVVAPNSAALHLAGAMRHRCILLIGSCSGFPWVMDYEKTLAVEVPCPKSKPKCWWNLSCLPGSGPFEREKQPPPPCMADISVEQVMEGIEHQLHPKKIVVMLLTYNCLESTKRAVDSLRSFHDYKIYCSDGGSTDGTLAWLKEKGIPFVSRKCSVTEAQNAGLRMILASGPFDYLFVLNNDVVLSPTYLDTLVETAERLKCASVTGKVVDSREHSLFEFHGLTAGIEAPLTALVAGDFSAHLISHETVEKLGAFDEQYYPRYQEDEDYTLRIRLSGGTIIRTYRATFWHHLGTTIQSHEEEMKRHQKDWDRNCNLFAKKWGFHAYKQRMLYPNLPAIKKACSDWQKKIHIPLKGEK